MKIVVFGASGGTGQHLVQQGLAQGYLVTAFGRSPEAILAAPAPGFSLVKGDVHDAESVSAAIAGQDAVLSALGARTLGRSDVLETGVRNILAGMESHRVNRIIVLGAAGASEDATRHQGVVRRLSLKFVISVFLREPFRSQREQERLLQASSVDYTIVRPPRLLNIPGAGHYRVQEDGLPPAGTTISRADVADFMIRQLANSTWIRKGPYLAA